MTRDIIEELRAQIQGIEGESPSMPEPSHGGRAGRQHNEASDTDGGLDEPASKDLDAAYQRVIKLCGYRERTRKQLKDRLILEDYDADIAEAAIEKAASYGIVDDARFAAAYAHDAVFSKKGISAIRRSLAEAGVADPIIEEVTSGDGFGEEDQLQAALGVLRARTITAKNKHDAAYRRLVQKGFSSAVAAKAARIWCDSAGH